MDLVFNDLSTLPLAENISEAGKRLHEYFTVINKLKDDGFSRVRYIDTFDNIILTPEHSLLSFCKLREPASLRTISNTLLSLSRHPFIDDDSEEEIRFIQNKFYIIKDGKPLEAPALGTAYLYNTIAVSLNSEEYWRNLEHELTIRGDEEQKTSILAVCSVEHCKDTKFTSWKEKDVPIELIESTISPDKKKIHFREDHGKDVLKAFAERIRKSPYITEIINSMPFNKHDRDFIRKVKSNGLIEIVLTHTDLGFGMVVKTTGRTLKETQAIAEILRKEYAE